jgi:hypothetical protein
MPCLLKKKCKLKPNTIFLRTKVCFNSIENYLYFGLGIFQMVHFLLEKLKNIAFPFKVNSFFLAIIERIFN